MYETDADSVPAGFVVVLVFLRVVATGWLLLCGCCVSGKGNVCLSSGASYHTSWAMRPVSLCDSSIRRRRYGNSSRSSMVLSMSSVWSKQQLCAHKHRVIRRNIAVLFLGEFVELSGVCICLSPNFQRVSVAFSAAFRQS